MKKFVFLIASERSGSNFITSLFDGHSAVCGPSPTHLFRLFGTNFERYGDLEHEPNWTALVDDFYLNFEAQLGQWNATITKAGLKSKALKRTPAELLRIIYEMEASFKGAEYILVKENHTWQFAGFLMTHFPDCRFIYLVRDPRDVASSYLTTDGIPGGVEKAVLVWREDQQNSAALYDRLLGTDRIILVRYEDLVQDTGSELMRILDFLGLAFEPDMLDFWQSTRARKNADRIEAWSNLSRGVMNNNFNKYHKVLSDSDLRYVEFSCHELMKRFGYKPEMVDRLPYQRELMGLLEALRPNLSKGNYSISNPMERRIRQKRLAAINRVFRTETS